MHNGCKVYMDSYMASNGSCFMVISIIFQNHLLEVGLTQNQETMALHMLTTDDLFYFIMYENRMNIDLLKKHLVEGLVTHGFTLDLKVRDHTT